MTGFNEIIALLTGALALCGAVYLIASLVGLRRFLQIKDPIKTDAPPITVLKPLYGAEAHLYENLASFCRQTAPTHQIVFGVRDPADPAIETVRRLQAAFPDSDLALVVDQSIHGTNLKVSNLINMMTAAKHDLLVIADADMAAPPDYLAILAAALDDPQVGLATCLYVGRPVGGLWSALGAMHLTHGFLPSVLVGRLVNGRVGCFGATMALRRSDLEAIGGLASLKNYLADDYYLGAKVQALGKSLHLTRMTVTDYVLESGLKPLFLHELRWARTIRSIAPLDFAGTVVTHPVAWSLITALLTPGATPSLALCAAILTLRLALIRVFDHTLGTPRTPTYLIPIRDLLSFVVLAAAYCGRSVSWRDQWFRVDADGQLVIDGDRPA